jgi:hypothetical protein
MKYRITRTLHGTPIEDRQVEKINLMNDRLREIVRSALTQLGKVKT